jgi:hypothetical protein
MTTEGKTLPWVCAEGVGWLDEDKKCWSMQGGHLCACGYVPLMSPWGVGLLLGASRHPESPSLARRHWWPCQARHLLSPLTHEETQQEFGVGRPAKIFSFMSSRAKRQCGVRVCGQRSHSARATAHFSRTSGVLLFSPR